MCVFCVTFLCVLIDLCQGYLHDQVEGTLNGRLVQVTRNWVSLSVSLCVFCVFSFMCFSVSPFHVWGECVSSFYASEGWANISFYCNPGNDCLKTPWIGEFIDRVYKNALFEINLGRILETGKLIQIQLNWVIWRTDHQYRCNDVIDGWWRNQR